MRNGILTLILLSLILYVGCFEHQDYDLEEPEWPRYDVGGVVVDSATKEPLEDCIVKIERWILYYEDDDFISATDTSDSNGLFLCDSIAAGHCWIYLTHEEYPPCTCGIIVFFPPHDSLNLRHRYALIKPLDIPSMAVSDSIFVVRLQMDDTTDRKLTIFNKNERGRLNLRWALTGDGGWLIVNPKTGSVSPGGKQKINLHFDASSLTVGLYTRTLFIRSVDFLDLGLRKEILIWLQVVSH